MARGRAVRGVVPAVARRHDGRRAVAGGIAQGQHPMRARQPHARSAREGTRERPFSRLPRVPVYAYLCTPALLPLCTRYRCRTHSTCLQNADRCSPFDEPWHMQSAAQPSQVHMSCMSRQ